MAIKICRYCNEEFNDLNHPQDRDGYNSRCLQEYLNHHE